MEDNAFSDQNQQDHSDSAQQNQPAEELTQDAKNMAMLCHLLAIFTGFLGPLILWLIKKDDHQYIDAQGKEALNFQITVMLASLVCIPLCAVCIGFVLLPVIGIADLVLCIMACVAASNGQDYRYPCSIRLVK